jgi:hypothetical protein
MQYVKKQINTRKEKKPLNDHNFPFDIANPKGSTKAQFVKVLSEVFASNNITINAQNEILKAFFDHTTSLALPVKPLTAADIRSGKLRNNMTAYLDDDYRHHSVDVCHRGCMSFFGTTLIRCAICRSPRYSHCGHADCKDKPYDSCNPFPTQDDNPTMKHHDVKYRIPLENAYIRSMTSRFTEMCCLSFLEGQQDFLNYDRVRYKKHNKMMDALDGENVMRHNKIMSDNFEAFKPLYLNANTKSGVTNIHECSLAYTLAYDGKINFERSSDSMWPMIISCLNCNPNDRQRSNRGLSLGMLHNLKINSKAETQLLNLMGEEIKALERGIVFVIPQDGHNNDIHVYLQARCVFAHLDTKGLESLLLIQGSGSLYGCSFCNMCKGMTVALIGKVCFCHTRNSVPENHVSRFIGEAVFRDDQHQADYFSNEAHIKAELTERGAPDAWKDKINTTCTSHHKLKVPAPGFHCSVNVKQLVWYNNKFPFAMFKRHMRFEYIDPRPQVFYEHDKDANYKFDGSLAQITKDTKEAERIAAGKAELKKPATYPVNGKHGVCGLMCEDPEALNFECLTFDEMHAIMNAANYFLWAWGGTRGKNPSSQAHCVATGKHPYMACTHTSFHQPFEMTGPEQQLCDAVINCVLIPSFYKTDLQIKNPLGLTSYLISHQKKVLLTVYSSYMVAFSTNLASDYKDFAARYADDLNRLLDPELDKDELRNDITWSVYETRIIQEGLFPISETVYIFHELQCIINNIVNQGPLKFLSTYTSEREIGKLGRFVTHGGMHYVKNLHDRYVSYENNSSNFDEGNIDNFDNCGKFSDMVLKLTGVGKPQGSTLWALNDKSALFDYVIQFLGTQETPRACFENSVLYRVYKGYTKAKQVKKLYYSCTFCDWFARVNTALNDVNSALCVSDYILQLVRENEPPLTFADMLAGTVHLRDFMQIRQGILNFNPPLHNTAIVKGIHFRARGMASSEAGLYYRPTKLLTESEMVRNPHNVLASTWFRPVHYGSFMKIQDWIPIGNATEPDKLDAEEQTPRFAQANAFFRLNIGDPGVDGLAMANVTARTPFFHKYARHYYLSADDHETVYFQQKFVCLQYVVSTAIGVSALHGGDDATNQMGKPLLKPTDSLSYSDYFCTSGHIHHKTYAPRDAVLTRLYLIELHPNRLKLSYDGHGVFDDVLGLRVCER